VKVGLIALVARYVAQAEREGMVVRDGGYLRETCPTCGAVAMRPVDMPRSVRVFPPGHEILRDHRGRAVGDRCPSLTSA